MSVSALRCGLATQIPFRGFVATLAERVFPDVDAGLSFKRLVALATFLLLFFILFELLHFGAFSDGKLISVFEQVRFDKS
jgi:hypothetical protein